MNDVTDVEFKEVEEVEANDFAHGFAWGCAFSAGLMMLVIAAAALTGI